MWWKLLFLIVMAGHASVGAQSNCFLRLAEPYSSNVDSVINSLESRGILVRHVFLPNEYIVKTRPEIAKYLAQENKAYVRHKDLPGPFGPSVPSSTCIEWAWEKLMNPWILRGGPGPTDTTNYCGSRVDIVESTSQLRTSPQFGPDKTDMFNANYLTGSITLGVILMESQGSDRNWNQAQEDTAIAETIHGCELLISHAEGNHSPIRWHYRFWRAVPTGEEPINVMAPEKGTFGWSFSWIDDALDYLGFGSEWDGTHDLANWLRTTGHTDWGYSLFICMNQPQEPFPGEFYGYHIDYGYGLLTGYLYNAAFSVASYSGQYGSEAMHARFAHEIAHGFGASDEYIEAPLCSDPEHCGLTYGYLNHENLNCQACGQSSPCLMRWHDPEWSSICPPTARHLGISDTDADGHPDAIDPNNNRWATVHNVQSGDIVRIFTSDGDLVDVFAVTQENMDTHPSGNTMLWDCLNFDAQPVAPTYYYYTVDNGPTNTLPTFAGSPASPPVVNGVSWSQDTLRWEMSNGLGYLSLDIFAYKWQVQDTILMASPQKNRFHLSSTDKPHKKQALPKVWCDPCRAHFVPWRPDGGSGTAVDFFFSSYKCGDWTQDRSVDISDISACIAYLTVPGMPDTPAPRIAKDVNCSGNVDLSDLSAMYAFLVSGAPLHCCY